MTHNASRQRAARITCAAIAAVAGAVALLWVAARRWRSQALARLHRGAQVISTAAGAVEAGIAGDGVPVLVFHATPGGYDQGLVLAGMLGGGLHAIALSRPGYLRTPLATGRSPAAQAAAAAVLLDTLDLARVAVVGVSGGGPAAIELAARFPERVSRLVLWQAVSQRHRMDAATVSMLTRSFMATDLGAWLILCAARVAAWGALSRSTRWDRRARQRFRAFLTTFYPLDLRRDGVLNDAWQNANLADLPLHVIAAPTLVVHGSADTTVPYQHAVAAAQAIPHAQLVTVPGGTHETTFVAPQALAAIGDFLRQGAPL